MLQTISISEARNNLAKLIQKVKETKKPVIIIRDSQPAAILYPYEEAVKQEEQKDKLFQQEFRKAAAVAQKRFKQYLKEKSINVPSTEEEAYSIIKNG